MTRTMLLILLLLAACGQQGTKTSTKDLTVFDVQDEAATESVAVSAPGAPPPPDIGPSAAPGVAFNYRYDYRVAAPRISGVQEAHAQMCERLGLARCRITGMRYTVQDERHVDASLSLALEPSIARRFGRETEAAVTRANGALVNMEIGGRDVGTGIARAGRDAAAIRRELAQAERDLDRPGLNASTRERLLTQADQLRRELQALEASQDAGREELATTPMVINYGSGADVPGIAGSPLRDALRDSGDNFTFALAALVRLISILLPWVLTLALAVWLTFRVAAWRQRRDARAAATEPTG